MREFMAVTVDDRVATIFLVNYLTMRIF